MEFNNKKRDFEEYTIDKKERFDKFEKE